jgi:hypothetical protein
MKDYNFKYDLLKKIYIPELGVSGNVIALTVTFQGIKYLVTYFFNGKKEEVWFYDFQIRRKK